MKPYSLLIKYAFTEPSRSLTAFGMTAFLLISCVAVSAEQSAVEDFLQAQTNNTFGLEEGAELQNYIITDLDQDASPEIVLVWTTLGKTYWRNTLTVLSKKRMGYEAVATLPLTGEAKLTSVKENIITVDQRIYTKEDPVCCPTQNKTFRYIYQKESLFETP